MTPAEFEAARKALDLSYDELADVLGVSSRAVRKWEEEGTGNARKPNPIAVRAMRWFQDGFRPPEWPAKREGV